MEQIQKNDPYLGMTLDGALLEKKLGQGGMGSVYLARHLTLEKYIAIKILPPEFTRTSESVERFLREARSAAKLEHTNIVQIYNAGQQDGVHFISMQFVSGDSLENQITKLKKIPLPQALWIMRSSIQGLAFAHRNQIIHRDIKPDNIMITSSGEVKVVDFGLARSSESGNTLSSPGQIMGTPYFMSPEQCNGDTADQRSDIYSLGITFYYMISGTRPYDGNSAVSILMQHAGPDPVRTLNPDHMNIPPMLSQIIKKMMEKDPQKRYQHIEDILPDLESLFLQIPPMPLKVEAVALPNPQQTQSTRAPTLISQKQTARTLSSSADRTDGNLQPDIPTLAYTSMAGNELKTIPISDLPLKKNKGVISSSSYFQDEQDTKKPWGKLFLIVLLLGITVFFVGNTLKKHSKKRAFQQQKEWTEREIASLKKETPIDFEGIRSLYKTLQTQYPESESWCQEQVVALAQEEKAYAKVFLEISEKELRQDNPVPFDQMRALYDPIESQYPANPEWCKLQQERLFQEEFTFLLTQQKYVKVVELLVHSIQKEYPSLYEKMFPDLKNALELAFQKFEKEKTIPAEIQGKELEFLELYQNLFALKENDLNKILFYQREIIELLFSQISEIGGNDFPLLIESFAFACQIPDEQMLFILKGVWGKLETSIVTFIRHSVQFDNLEKINYVLKYIKSFLPGNKVYQQFFEKLGYYLEQQAENMGAEEKIRLKNKLQKTLFPLTFPKAWAKLGGQKTEQEEESPLESAKKAEVEEFIQQAHTLQKKYQELRQKHPFQAMRMIQPDIRKLQKKFFELQQDEEISEELMIRIMEELAQLKAVLPGKGERMFEPKKDRRFTKEPKKKDRK